MVTIPQVFGPTVIPSQKYSAVLLYRVGAIMPNGEEIKCFSEKFSMPVVSSVLEKGIISNVYENYLCMAA